MVKIPLNWEGMMTTAANNDALMEALRIASNPQLAAKITAGMKAVARGEVHPHQLVEETERR
jgi:PHD/YefM family antitoxin component YafN of YafNO toxin-antitoxin module